MSKKYVYGIIHERSRVTDDVIHGGKIIQVYTDEISDERVLVIQTHLGTIYETFDKYFVTEPAAIAEIVNEISRKMEIYKDKCKKASETVERCMRYLNKQTSTTCPDIKKVFAIQGQLEKAEEELEKMTPTMEILHESLLNCYEVTRKMK